eukprot:CAMPEP_0204910508 /NCGR_PEP_ID=MMETSP1397-20131031/9019_1 /ASSEMBLY_ACC=CAM_ASM_000891 /TAXON_ID=49980 /ORGANISM="Climacostomum Climacostomum virens, Strain Stock W-24" /LENGTH=245 /DNA_ID=CAMNT_0052080699 /DNA_START=420 /DNA_END=1154 /DNA_ORIENTATION=-
MASPLSEKGNSETQVVEAEASKEEIETPKRISEASPQYFYSYKENSSLLFQTSVSTGETREETVKNHTFKYGSVWCEGAGGDIYFTGGYTSYEAVQVSGSSFEVTFKPDMLDARCFHGSVFNDNYLYAIGGSEHSLIRECERLLVSEDRWETLQPLPRACDHVSVVVVKETECLYVLGGCNELIQRLSLRRLEWSVISLKPQIAPLCSACFSYDSKVWFEEKGKLYCMNALAEYSITLIKEVRDT